MYIVIVASSRRSSPFHAYIYIPYILGFLFDYPTLTRKKSNVLHITYGCHDIQRSTMLFKSSTVTNGRVVLSDYHLLGFMGYHYEPSVNSDHFSDICYLRFTDHVYIRHSSPLSSFFQINTERTSQSIQRIRKVMITKAKASTLPSSMIRYAHLPFTISVIKVLGSGTGSFEGSWSIARRSRLVGLGDWDRVRRRGVLRIHGMNMRNGNGRRWGTECNATKTTMTHHFITYSATGQSVSPSIRPPTLDDWQRRMRRRKN